MSLLKFERLLGGYCRCWPIASSLTTMTLYRYVGRLGHQSRNFGSRNRSTDDFLLAIRTIQLRQITLDGLLDRRHASRQPIVGEVLLPMVDSLEFASINRDRAAVEKVEASTKRHKLSTDLADSRAIIFAEIGNGLEVRCKSTGQLHHLDVATAFTLKSAR